MRRRDRVLAALRHEVGDRAPMDFELSPSQVEQFRSRTNEDDYRRCFGLELRFVKAAELGEHPDWVRYLGDVPEGARVDEWGIGHWRKNPELHFEHLLHPLERCETLAQIEEYPFPDFSDETRYAGLSAEVARLKAEDYFVIGHCLSVGGTVLWPAYKLRSMEEHLLDLVLRPDLAVILLDRVTDAMIALAKNMAVTGVDALLLADDFGTQQSLLVSRDLFRKWYKPRLRKVVDAARSVNQDIVVMFHSDGAIEPLIRDLIDVGIDVLNPVQPECMEPGDIKRRFGHELCFYGTVGTQTTMPFGTPEEVKRVVTERIRTVGRGGGLIVAPTHVVEPEVPWENLLAFVEAVNETGSYA
ncbi:MAG: uroporphyrinogen decarboxylase family protein [Planctomycetota bacterium]